MASHELFTADAWSQFTSSLWFIPINYQNMSYLNNRAKLDVGQLHELSCKITPREKHNEYKLYTLLMKKWT